VEAVGNKQQARGQNPKEQDHRQRVEAFVEVWPAGPNCGLD
jgi:hypothetical protein